MTTRTVSPFYLFLDFDGVLHHGEPGQVNLFALADRLGTALAKYPEVQVVVSSSWREVYSFDELRDFCGPSLGLRLVDVTPIFDRGQFYKRVQGKRSICADCELLRGGDRSFAEYSSHSRFVEIAMWLAVVGIGGKTPSKTVTTDALARDDWAALDDMTVLFPKDCSQLIFVEDGVGLGAQHIRQLEGRLLARR